MKLANLSVCLVLALVLGGCFNGTNSPNSVAQEQEVLQTQDLELLQNLQSIDLNKAFDSKGALSKYGKAEFNELKKISNDKPIILFVDKIEPKVMQNLQNGFRELNSKQEFLVYGVADRAVEHIFPSSFDASSLKTRPRELRDALELCLANGSLHCISGLKGRVKGELVTGSRRAKLAEADEAMFAIYDANMTNSKVEKASIQRKAKQ